MGDTTINPNSSNPSGNLAGDHEDSGPSGTQSSTQTSTQTSTLYSENKDSHSVLEYIGFFFHHASGGEQKKLAMKAAQGGDITSEEIQKADKLQQISEKAVQVQANGIALGAAVSPSGGPIVGETAANLVIGKVVDAKTDPAGSFPGGTTKHNETTGTKTDHKETTGTKPADTPPPNLPATPTPQTTPGGSSKPFDEELYHRILLQLQKAYEPKKPELPKPPEPKKKGTIKVTLSEPDPPKDSGTIKK